MILNFGTANFVVRYRAHSVSLTILVQICRQLKYTKKLSLTSREQQVVGA